MDLDDIPQPDDAVARAALEVAAAYHSPALLNHCRRSYLWAASYGVGHGIDFDADLLHVSSMLHDIGLVPAFDSHTLPFEQAGGHVAWVFGAGAGWPTERRRRAGEIIVRHMWRTTVDADSDPEAHLLTLATTLDISGHDADRWPARLREAVVGRYPRLSLREEFLRCFEDQARRKPDSTAAISVRSGLARRLATNPLERIAPPPTAALPPDR